MTAVRLPTRLTHNEHGASGADCRPLTLAQECVLARDELLAVRGRPGLVVNVVEYALVAGPLDLDRLESAVCQAINRHQLLRGGFVRSANVPRTARDLFLQRFQRNGVCTPGLYVQDSCTSHPAALEVVDRRRLTGALTERHLEDLLRTELSRPFVYSRGPHVHARLVRCEERKALLFLAVPRLVGDAASVRMLMSEVWDEYGMSRDPATVPRRLPAEPFSAYASWEHQQLFTAYFDSDAEYWLELWHRSTSRQIGSLSVDGAHRLAARTSLGSFTDTIQLGPRLFTQIAARCAACGVAPYAYFLAAYFLLLSRVTRSSFVTIWITCGNRALESFEETFGPLATTHMIAWELPTSAPPPVIIDSCRRLLVEAFSHERISLPVLWFKAGKTLDVTRLRVSYEWDEHAPCRSIGNLTVDSPPPIGSRSLATAGLIMRVVQRGSDYQMQLTTGHGYLQPGRVRELLDAYRQIVETFSDGCE